MGAAVGTAVGRVASLEAGSRGGAAVGVTAGALEGSAGGRTPAGGASEAPDAENPVGWGRPVLHGLFGVGSMVDGFRKQGD